MKGQGFEFRGVVWLDRDGTVVDDPGYLADPEKLVLLEGAADAIAELNRKQLAVVLITNQSGIARGLMSRETVDAIHAALIAELRRHDAELEGIFLCPHLPPELVPANEVACDCRKPRPGLVERARDELGLAALSGVVVGDKVADLQLGETLGLPALLVLSGEGERTRAVLSAQGSPPPEVAADLRAGVPWILRRLGIES